MSATGRRPGPGGFLGLPLVVARSGPLLGQPRGRRRSKTPATSSLAGPSRSTRVRRLVYVAIHREIEGERPLRPQPIERLAGRHERRRDEGAWHVATGTLACPACDGPVLPDPGGMSLRDLISCGFCQHAGAVRDFLSLAEPTRPARVAVRVRGLALF